MRISKQSSPAQIMKHQKQLENVDYFNSLGITKDDARGTREIKSGFVMTKAAFNKKEVLFTGILELNLRTKSEKCCIWSVGFV